MNRYSDLINRAKAQHGEQFDDSNINKDFIRHYESNARIEVEYYGEVIRGRIGVTTGWKPCFLLMRRKSDHGSSYTIPADESAVKYLRTVTA